MNQQWLSIVGFFAACALVAGCSDTPDQPVTENFDVSLSLPGPSFDITCSEDLRFGGGDLAREFDRIAVGTIESIEVNDALSLPFEDCDPDSIDWTLRVVLSISRNLQGTGDSLTFKVGPSTHVNWASRPMYQYNDQWLPADPRRTPKIQSASRLGWTGASGIHVGQELLVLLHDTDEGLTPSGAPMAEIIDGAVTFQYDELPPSCVRLEEGLSSGLEIDEFQQRLVDSEVAPDISLQRQIAETSSWCTPRSDPG